MLVGHVAAGFIGARSGRGLSLGTGVARRPPAWWLTLTVGSVVLTLAWLQNIAGPPPPDPGTAPVASLVFFSLTVLWGALLQRLARRRSSRLLASDRVVAQDAAVPRVLAPTFVPPMTAVRTPTLPEGDDWLYEVKLDGYRAIAIKDGSTVRLRSRNDKDLSRAYPEIAGAVGRLRARTATVDGEIVAVDASGHPSFQALQNRAAFPDHRLAYYAFDALHVDGEDLTGRPLRDRKARLPALVAGSGMLVSASLRGTAAQITEAVRSLGLEGIVAKRAASKYAAGTRSDAWLKFKLEQAQELVVGGFRRIERSVDALLVGYYEQRTLRFAGKVRAGFTPRTRALMFDRLQPLVADRCPFADLPSVKAWRWGGGVTAEQMAEMTWVAPRVVVQIRFAEWTVDGHLRHAAFVGLRDDKQAAEVTRE